MGTHRSTLLSWPVLSTCFGEGATAFPLASWDGSWGAASGSEKPGFENAKGARVLTRLLRLAAHSRGENVVRLPSLAAAFASRPFRLARRTSFGQRLHSRARLAQLAPITTPEHSSVIGSGERAGEALEAGLRFGQLVRTTRPGQVTVCKGVVRLAPRTPRRGLPSAHHPAGILTGDRHQGSSPGRSTTAGRSAMAPRAFALRDGLALLRFRLVAVVRRFLRGS